MTNRSFQIPLRVLVLALLYFVTGRLGLMLPAFGSQITLIWLPTGIAVAALLRFGFACWPGVALGSMAVNFTMGSTWPVVMGISVGNTAAPLLAAWLLRRMGFHAAFDRQRDILLLAMCAGLGMVLSASSGVTTLALAGELPGSPLAAWLIWWAGDTMGVIAAAPLLLALTRQEWRWIAGRRAEFLTLIAVAALSIVGVFLVNKGLNGHAWAVAFLPLPLVAWAALRFRAIGTSIVLIALSAGAAYASATGRGPFFRPSPISQAVMLWLFMATSAVIGWLINALHAARSKATGMQHLLEQALSEVSLGVLLGDLDRKITYASAGFTRLTGYSGQELLGQSCRILQGPKTDPAVAEELRAAMHEGGFFDGEILNYRKDGSTFWNALLISPVLDERGERTGFLGIQRDVSERKLAEQALLRSEAQYRTLADHLPDVVARFDRDRRHVYVNPVVEVATGLKPEAFIGKTNEEIGMPPQLTEVWKATLERVFGNGGDERVEFLYDGPRGSSFWESVVVAEHGANGGVESALVLSRDITARKRAEARSESERVVLELLAAGAPLGAVLDRLVRSYEEIFPGMLCSVLVMDADGKRLRHGAAPSLPEAFCRAVDGAEIGPAAGSCGTAAYTRQVTLVADIATDPLWKDYRDLALGHGLQACWSVPVISPQDRVLGTFAVYYRQPQAARPEEVATLGRGAHFAGLAIERHRLIDSLRDSEAALLSAQERAHLGSWELDLATNRGWWSREMFRLFQCDPEAGSPDFAGFIGMLHPDDRQRVAQPHARLAENPGPWTIEFRSDPARGPMRHFSATVESIPGAPGRPGKAAGTVLDITAMREAQIEREKLSRKMQETQKLESLGVLAGGIAHDFNNLLTGILGNASLASMDLPPRSPVLDYIGQINDAAQRAAELCKQMLAYSGRGRFVIQQLDLGQLVEETTQMLQISISKKAVLRFRLEKGLPPVEVDATQIRQVIMNLVINASEAIGEQSGVIALSTGLTRVDRSYLGGTMTATELPDGDYVFLEVSDSGCGMDAEIQARIFDPFFTTKFTGRGLGLAAVLGIVRGHKGALKVYSEQGSGTTFKLLFPAASGPAETLAEKPAASVEWSGSGTVLVVDDEETIRSTAARMLQRTGFDIVLVSDGREAVEVFRADPGRFTLVLLDLTMPHMDGEETFAELRRMRADVRVVLMSGFNRQEALVRFPGKGLSSFLQKPFTFAAFRDVLQRVLG